MAFDPTLFLETVHTAPSSTEYLLLSKDEIYTGVIETVEARTGKGKDGKSYLAVDVKVKASGEEIKKAIRRDSVVIKYGMMLDIDESGSLMSGEGYNVKLGKLREVLGQNKSGVPWRFADLKGGALRFMVSHRKGEDEQTFQEIAKLLPL